MVKKPVADREPINNGASVTGHAPKGVWMTQVITNFGGLFVCPKTLCKKLVKNVEPKQVMMAICIVVRFLLMK